MDGINKRPLVTTVSFLCGTLFPNGVMSKEESDELTKKYSDIIGKKIFAQS